ncbi:MULTISPECIES: 2OG-Fe(II) oxygenase [Pseudanabaena]|uniref:2OG-Fe(II) oxygenase n=2 Tax=Pseudanabaena TaxID=1152 RepID=L8MYB6_9CYAN|nr:MULTISPECIES: 2OG-Fe(II) oxygenase [Pseudanabaena]ELS31774.1 2OG-Fe(II) oxygenase [Pseudanabaena biceps PCC 7429]MDG3495970.1 2OG-Fe(II) oxygenase [Pseudanabaena catenata USMAC16]
MQAQRESKFISEIISEDKICQVESLIKQLDLVRHIAESGFWLSTDELAILLNLDGSFIRSLDNEIAAPNPNYKFFWRNFECILADRQFEKGFWLLRTRDNSLVNTSINKDQERGQEFSKGAANHTNQASNSAITSKTITSEAIPSEAISLNPPPETKVIPTPYALIENFLSQSQLNDLLRYSIRKQAEFVPTSNSANDPNYRKSFFLAHFPEFSELMIDRVRKITPQIIKHLDINNFAIGQIESQLTAHNHGNFYKIHNDSGSPEDESRILTYVYYFNREPKAFTGGELVIYDSKIENGYYVAANSFKTIKPTNNTIIFFPSHCMHEVLPVSCPSEYFADSRFTINGWVRHV